MYIQRVSFYPALGKMFELRALLEERVKSRQAQGITIGLQEQLFGSEGAGFTLESGRQRAGQGQPLEG